jgi:hypothetical protein
LQGLTLRPAQRVDQLRFAADLREIASSAAELERRARRERLALAQDPPGCILRAQRITSSPPM